MHPANLQDKNHPTHFSLGVSYIIPMVMASSRATTKVVVVGGGGTMGSSTALHLLRSGYTPSNIIVLDVYPFPSAQSAGNDLNKIMGIRVSSPVEMRLSLEAADMWKNDDLFKPFFHNTGRVSEEEEEDDDVKFSEHQKSDWLAVNYWDV